ncbi:hypothetical protein [Hallella colorans]|jgi:hypothetical protein|uniref:Phosphoglycolate phosphatase n=1 Tax=Hallella colorans TaxID=1703337 RepID=A0A2U0U794_9BACT|nr:hypothetical protein [Hallella colorans]PVX53520.1 hypothetical protein C7379_11133 [Hallella colorans]
MRTIASNIKARLGRLSYRTGVTVLAMCIPFYILSFAQMALPIPTAAKGALWVALFGMAKTCQYCGITIVGAKGIKAWWQKRKKTTRDSGRQEA